MFRITGTRRMSTKVSRCKNLNFNYVGIRDQSCVCSKSQDIITLCSSIESICLCIRFIEKNEMLLLQNYFLCIKVLLNHILNWKFVEPNKFLWMNNILFLQEKYCWSKNICLAQENVCLNIGIKEFSWGNIILSRFIAIWSLKRFCQEISVASNV